MEGIKGQTELRQYSSNTKSKKFALYYLALHEAKTERVIVLNPRNIKKGRKRIGLMTWSATSILV